MHKAGIDGDSITVVPGFLLFCFVFFLLFLFCWISHCWSSVPGDVFSARIEPVRSPSRVLDLVQQYLNGLDPECALYYVFLLWCKEKAIPRTNKKQDKR